MNYPELENKYKEWLAKHSIMEIDELPFQDFICKSNAKEIVWVATGYIISDLYQLDRCRKIKELKRKIVRTENYPLTKYGNK